MPRTDRKIKILVLLTALAVHATLLAIPTSGVEVEVYVNKNVLNEIDANSYAYVTVTIVDDYRGVFYDGDYAKRNYLKPILSDIISELSSDFNISGTYSQNNGFYGYINKAGIDKLKGDSRVSAIYLNRPGKYALDSSAPLINADDVWSIQVNGINVTGTYGNTTICVIDSGVDYNHSALGGCFGDGCEVIGGYDFCNSIDASGNCITYDNNPMDVYGHGTMVAGVAVSSGLLKGVAFGAKIVALKNGIVKPDPISTEKAIRWCIDNSTAFNITVITLSSVFGEEVGYSNSSNCFSDHPISIAIEDALKKGISVTSAAGNDCYIDKIAFPACTNATSVGTTYDETMCLGECFDCCYDDCYFQDEVSCKTNRFSNLDLLAPGCKINSTNISVTGYDEDCGSSLAAPHVAGAISLLVQYEKMKNNRVLTPMDVEERLKDTGKLIYDGGASSNNSGTNLTLSRIDVYSALFPIDVYDFERVSASDTYNVFFFKVKNNYNNKTKAVNWTFDIGNGTIVTSEQDAELSPGEDFWVFFEENYTDGDIYNVKATGASGTDSDTEEMTLTLGDIIAHDMKLTYSNGGHKVFFFKILNNMDTPQLVNWTFYTGAETVHADKLTLLQSGEDVWVYFENNYTSPGTYNVRARAFNVNSTDYTETITVNVGDTGSSSGIGNYTMTTLGYSWIECDTDFWLPPDDGLKNFTLPFDFRFYNVTYEGNEANITIDSNGRLAFPAINGSDYTPSDSDLFSNKIVAVNWKDLSQRDHVQICNYSDANGGYTVVEYHSNWYSTAQQNSEVVFYENGTIRINYDFMANATTAGSTGKGSVWLGVSNDDGGTYFTRTIWHNVNENRSYTSYNLVPYA